jgi:hypothetical protein
MAWNEAVVTNAGVKLYTEALHGNGLEITRVTGGFSVYSAASLMIQTRTTAPEIPLAVAGVKSTASGRQITIRVDNKGAESAYTLRQVGVYAKEKGTAGNGVLLALIQDSKGVEIPANSANPEFILEFGFLLPISNECEIHVRLDPNILVTYEKMAEELEKKAAAEHSHSASEVGAAASSHTHTASQVGAAASNHSHSAADVGAEPARTLATEAAMRIGTETTVRGMNAALVRAGAAGAALLASTSSTDTPLVVTGLPSVTESHLTGRIITIRCTAAISRTAATNIQPSGGTSRALQINGAAVSAANPLIVPANGEIQVRLDGTIYRLIGVFAPSRVVFSGNSTSATINENYVIGAAYAITLRIGGFDYTTTFVVEEIAGTSRARLAAFITGAGTNTFSMVSVQISTSQTVSNILSVYRVSITATSVSGETQNGVEISDISIRRIVRLGRI